MLRDGNRRAFGRSSGFSPTSLSGLVGWYRFGLGITVATGVSQWNDASGSGNHLKQATGTAQPLLQSDGSILFDGVSQFLKCTSFTLAQPTTLYILGRQVTWTNGNYLADGNSSATMGVRQITGSPQLYIISNGANTATTNKLAVNTLGVIAAVFNGASSSIQINNNAAATGTINAGVPSGFTLGANATPAAWGNLRAYEVLLYSTAHNAAQITSVVSYLQQVGGL